MSAALIFCTILSASCSNDPVEDPAGGSLLESVKLFDIYRGKGVEEGKKSMAYSIVLRAADHTLTDTEAEAVTEKMLRKLEAAGATLRS